jgi:hypothetical protein
MISGNPGGSSYRLAMRGGALILGFAAVMALWSGASVSAQGAAAPAAFDGEYTGIATSGAGRGPSKCLTDENLRMTIAAPRVTIYSVDTAGRPRAIYSGTVDASGTVSASAEFPVPATPAMVDLKTLVFRRTLSGSIRSGRFFGIIVQTGECTWDVTMRKK